MIDHKSFTCFLELSSFAFCVSASSSWSINITRDGRVITSRWGLVVDMHSSLLFQAVFPQTSVVLSPGQASSLITASQFRHDIVAKAFCHGIGAASTALFISWSLTWMVQGFLLGMSFWNNPHLHLFSCSLSGDLAAEIRLAHWAILFRNELATCSHVFLISDINVSWTLTWPYCTQVYQHLHHSLV